MDHRREPRYAVEMGIEFRKKDSDAVFPGNVRNLSIGGMLIEAEDALAFGEELTVRFQISAGGDVFELPAIVRWTTPTGMGVQFKSIGVRETHAITELAAHLARQKA